MSKYLNQVVRVTCEDGRNMYGVLQAFTSQSDVILYDAKEQQPNGFDRSIGSVSIPGSQLTKICLQHR